jgi:hypothetical protein
MFGGAALRQAAPSTTPVNVKCTNWGHLRRFIKFRLQQRYGSPPFMQETSADTDEELTADPHADEASRGGELRKLMGRHNKLPSEIIAFVGENNPTDPASEHVCYARLATGLRKQFRSGLWETIAKDLQLRSASLPPSSLPRKVGRLPTPPSSSSHSPHPLSSILSHPPNSPHHLAPITVNSPLLLSASATHRPIDWLLSPIYPSCFSFALLILFCLSSTIFFPLSRLLQFSSHFSLLTALSSRLYPCSCLL